MQPAGHTNNSSSSYYCYCCHNNNNSSLYGTQIAQHGLAPTSSLQQHEHFQQQQPQKQLHFDHWPHPTTLDSFVSKSSLPQYSIASCSNSQTDMSLNYRSQLNSYSKQQQQQSTSNGRSNQQRQQQQRPPQQSFHHPLASQQSQSQAQSPVPTFSSFHGHYFPQANSTPHTQQNVNSATPQSTFHSRYQCLKKIGSGSFGIVYLAQDVYTQEKVAVKFEPKNCKVPQLIKETNFLRELSSYQQSHINVGVPRVRFLGETVNHYCMVQDLLGESLETLFQKQNRCFSLKTILLLADQMISRLEYIHSRNILHRDIKPENFLMGDPNSKHSLSLHIIDFGLSKNYLDSNGNHLPMKMNRSLTGTARYASINNHKGLEQSRRDDLESVGYTLIYFLTGGLLPWQNLDANTKEDKYRRIYEKKLSTPLHDLCARFPQEFKAYLVYVRSLDYQDTPNYSFLRKMFQELFARQGFRQDYMYDWVVRTTSPQY